MKGDSERRFVCEIRRQKWILYNLAVNKVVTYLWKMMVMMKKIFIVLII